MHFYLKSLLSGRGSHNRRASSDSQIGLPRGRAGYKPLDELVLIRRRVLRAAGGGLLLEEPHNRMQKNIMALQNAAHC